MLTDWLIFLDLLEENNFNTSFLRLTTPIIFGIIECHSYNYRSGYGYGYGYDYGYGNGYGFSYNSGYGNGYGFGYGNGYGDGNGNISFYDEEH